VRIIRRQDRRPTLKAMVRHWLGVGKSFLVIPRILAQLGFRGARIVGLSENGNTLLRLNRSYPMGFRGDVIEVPRDKVIFEAIRRRGHWSLDLSEFLREGLDEDRSALFDIGANIGVVALQTMRTSIRPHHYILFEPLPRNFSALQRNIQHANLGLDSTIEFHQVALSDRAGNAEFYTEAINYGNSSLFGSAMTFPQDAIRHRVRTVNTADFFGGLGSKFTRVVIKCDAQGADALILSRIPLPIWKKCGRAAVELWALSELKKPDIDECMSHFGGFDLLSWDPQFKSVANIEKVREFWSSGSGEIRDLYMIKTT